VWDLVGNVTEWSRDDYQYDDEPCWSTAGILQDPECDTPSPALGLRGTSRGGSWQTGGTQQEAQLRESRAPNTVGVDVGFRCVRADR
jgi:formylglycine-generating enzyme required for sulfatase activity